MINEYFDCCLYFTVAKLSRITNKMAEEAFAAIGLSPTYAFLLMALNEKDGSTPKELSSILHITPSTTTRFLDKLGERGYIRRSVEGKNCFVYLTQSGKDIQCSIESSWKKLHQNYREILGDEESQRVTKITSEAAKKLDK